MNENIPHLRLVPPANRPAPGTPATFYPRRFNRYIPKTKPRVYTILDKMADRAATWCADKVREDFKDSSSLANTETPIAAAMGLAPHTIRICFLGNFLFHLLRVFQMSALSQKDADFRTQIYPLSCAPPAMIGKRKAKQLSI
jgi:hypothetical protein